ncbi:MAG TPA: SpoIIE family protein phosphatase [Terriglobia bacterium]|nr:SpoIIE family protein phosphatase [Terriglobia bacterium]
MGHSDSAHSAHRCSFSPDRQDPYLRLNTVTVFVRDQDRSLRFYVDQLGFHVALDTRFASGDRWLTVTPPDGTATLALVAPDPGSDEYKLIGRSTRIAFLTEDISAKVEEWRQRGVRFRHAPQEHPWGAMFATFEDADGNSFMLYALDEATREVEAQRRAHAERWESERRAALEMDLAKQTQAGLFPQAAPPLKTLDCKGVCLQARQVGGDYYDFLDLGRERLGLLIGDISGKGTAAALLMANLQAHVRNLCTTYWNRPFTPFALGQPERFLQTVNRLFCDNTTDSAYATLFFAEYDDTTRQLRYANCGHTTALLLRHDSNVERLESTCPVLGLSKGWECAVAERQLFPGDALALYTDGVTESFNEAGEEFGEERLIEALRQHRELSPPALVAWVTEKVRQFSPHEQHDDITLVVARCRGSG